MWRQPGIAGEVVGGGEGVQAAAGGGEEFCAKQIIDSDHAGDDLGVVVALEPFGDELVQLGELPVELDEVGGKSGDEFASHRLTRDPDVLSLGGAHRCGGKLVGVADLVFAKP